MLSKLCICSLICSIQVTVCDLGDDVLSAVGKGDVSGVKNLISKHKNELNDFINKREARSGQTPLMKSVLMGHTDIVKTLLELDEVDVTIGEKDGYTPMHGAGFQGRAEILKLLIKDRRKIDPNEFHKDGFAPIHRACWGQESRHTDTARVFVELGGVPWNVKSKKGTICRDITNNPATRNLMIEYQNKNKEL